ncbi:cytochrome P450 [Haloarchaeobius iranensis]|uniref:Cytochrome P450 n=1 Tax=Haloarchaeobius iranensis TaxID=996166 RepID=A0A1G9Y1B6_9EURY|nr:cytochrome P450 [Haloarchaeobius iranensis]SDN02243.1 Cytochrome P450 [Haloarchaeobius iranensis]
MSQSTQRRSETADSAASNDGDTREHPAGEQLPGPDGLPVLGETLSFLSADIEYGTELQSYGDVVGFEALGRQFVAVYDPEVVQEILVERDDEFCKGEFERQLGDLLAPDGLVFTEGEQWARDRRLLQPAFTPGRIRSFGDTMVARAAATVDGWDDGAVVDLRSECSRLTLDILTRTLLDLELDGERGRVVREVVDAIGDRTSGFASVLPDWLPTPTNRRFERRMNAMDDLLETLVAARRTANGDGHDDLLSTMLDAEYPDGSTMSAETVRDQLFTFLFAGHETTALGLTYALWLVAGDETVRADLDAELDSVCGASDPGFGDIPALELTGAVVDEALRLYPPAYAIYREPVGETTLGGYTVPDDSTVMLAAYQIHRDERWWDAPAEFRPRRWLAGDDDRPEYAYFPFGGGPRHCIGMRFARMELQLALATVLQRVRFERVTETLTPDAKTTLDSGPVEMRVERRDR